MKKTRYFYVSFLLTMKDGAKNFSTIGISYQKMPSIDDLTKSYITENGEYFKEITVLSISEFNEQDFKSLLKNKI